MLKYLQILGKKLPLDHPQLQAYKHITRLFSEACSPIDGLELDLFPWLRFLGNKNFQKLKAARDALDTWVDAEMKEAMVMSCSAFKLISKKINPCVSSDEQSMAIQLSLFIIFLWLFYLGIVLRSLWEKATPSL